MGARYEATILWMHVMTSREFGCLSRSLC